MSFYKGDRIKVITAHIPGIVGKTGTIVRRIDTPKPAIQSYRVQLDDGPEITLWLGMLQKIN
jgi:hypothetical protein